jgi:hypothetical protein
LYSRVRNFKIVLVLCIGFMGGCSDSDNRSVQTADQFSYSVLTSDNGKGLDLLEELNSSVLPNLKDAGAQEFAIWSRASDSGNDFEEIAEDKLVIMLRWKEVKTTRLADELGAMTGVSDVTTSLWEVSLRGGDGPIETGAGFYIHRFNRNLSEDVDQVLSLSEQAWLTWEPFWDAKTVGVWRDLDKVDESNGVTRLMRIAWYRDIEHWQATREFWREPDSLELFLERAALQLDDESWSANVQPH